MTSATHRSWNRCIRPAQIIGLSACLIGSVSACSSSDGSSNDGSEHADAATEFWEALVLGDRDAALSFVDPAHLESEGVSPWGRARSLENQFDWYDAVSWQWTFDRCTEVDTARVECTATATSAWFEALDVDPITATFVVRFSDDGILTVDEKANSFYTQYSQPVFGVFEQWVRTNHPDDAAKMFSLAEEVNPEILTLFKVNTQRFDEAQQET